MEFLTASNKKGLGDKVENFDNGSLNAKDKDVIVIGMLKKIELWDPATLKEYEKQKDFLSDDDFEDLANEINF